MNKIYYFSLEKYLNKTNFRNLTISDLVIIVSKDHRCCILKNRHGEIGNIPYSRFIDYLKDWEGFIYSKREIKKRIFNEQTN